MKTFGTWIALFLIVQAALTAAQYFMARRTVKMPLRIVILAANALIAIGSALLIMAGPVFLRPVQPLLTAIYAVLLPDAAADLVTPMTRSETPSRIRETRRMEPMMVPLKPTTSV